MAEPQPSATEGANAPAAVGAWLLIVVGVLVLVAPFVVAAGAAALWLDVVVGAALVILGGFGAYDAARATRGTAAWPAALTLLLGVALVAAPFFLEAGRGYWWVNIVGGLAVLAAGLYTYWTAHAGGVDRLESP